MRAMVPNPNRVVREVWLRTHGLSKEDIRKVLAIGAPLLLQGLAGVVDAELPYALDSNGGAK